VGDVSCSDFIEDRVARDMEPTFHAGGRRERSMALYNFLREHPCVCFNVIDILRVVG
jgi:hypothetical protein